MNPEWPWALWLIGPVMLGLALLMRVTAAWHQRALRKVFAGAYFDRVLPRSVRVRRVIRDLLILAAAGLLVVALAGPRFDKEIRTVKARGVDLVLAIDLSRSMNATDISPSRLVRAEREVVDLLRLVEGDRVGVVLYAGGAVPRLPLTEDTKAVSWVVEQLSTDQFQAQGSAVGPAIDAGMELLLRDETPAGKAILLLTDGEVHDPAQALAAADKAAAAGVTIYAMVIGETASPARDEKGVPVVNEAGQPVVVAPDLTLMTELAKRTGGAVLKSVASDSDVQQLYGQELRRKLAAVERDAHQRETWRAAFQYPLGFGLGLWLLASVVGEGRRRALVLSALLVGLLVGGSARAGTLEEAVEAYQAKRYPQAVTLFEQVAAERPSDPALLDRLAAARYRAGDMQGAAQAWDRVDALRNGDPDASFNAGNAHWMAGELDEAVSRYQRALEQAPGHGSAQKNLQGVQQELQKRLEEQPPQNQDPKKDDEQQGGGEDPQSGGGGQDQQEGEQQPKGEGEQQSGEGEGEGEQQPDAEDAQGNGQADSQPKPGEQGAEQGDQEQGDQGSPATDPGDLDGQDPGEDGQAGGASGAQEPGEGEGKMGAAEAGRLVDSVEEGAQRVRYIGRGTDKPW